MVFLRALRRMGRCDITAHGFRSSFRDWAADKTNVPTAVCEAALAHTLRDKTASKHRLKRLDIGLLSADHLGVRVASRRAVG